MSEISSRLCFSISADRRVCVNAPFLVVRWHAPYDFDARLHGWCYD